MRRSPLDDQIAELVQRRHNAVDLLVRSLIEIDTISGRLDVLLDRRQEERDAERPGRMA